MKKKILFFVFYLLLINEFTIFETYASQIEDLMMLCRCNVAEHEIKNYSNKIEEKIFKIGTNKEIFVSQNDVIELIKSEYYQGTDQYYECIQRIAPFILPAKMSINGKKVNISQSENDKIIKVPIRISQTNKTKIIFQYAGQEDNEFLINIRLMNDSTRDYGFSLDKNSVILVSEDTGKEYKLKSIDGFESQNNLQVTVPAKGSKLIKINFDSIESNEQLSFSTKWHSAGEVNGLAFSIIFFPKPLRVSWLNVESHYYYYSGDPDKQFN